MENEKKYPMLRLFLGIAKVFYIAVAVVLILAGLIGGCSKGAGSAVLGLIGGAIIGGLIYFFGMIWVDFIQIFIDIEENTRALKKYMENK